MKRSKSGAQKRKEAATARDAVAKLPKMTDFFKITEQSRPGTSTERDEENYSVQEKEDYDDQHQSDCEFPENVSCDLPANTQPSISKISESQFTPIPDDPCKWPESISDAQRCDIVKRGPHQLIMNFPYNNTTPRRRFSSNHYKRVLPNGESVSRSWLVYSGESDQVFCFCCKLFGKTLSPFCSGINTGCITKIFTPHIHPLYNSGIGAEFFMTCTFGIGMLYSDISLFTYVQIVVYFLNAAFQFYTSKVI